MKPDWDKLIEAYKDHESTLIADVDCTAGGKSLRQEVGVKGYPTIKHGDPNDLQDYDGGRDFESLKKFADDLEPPCSPSHIELCNEDKKKMIEGFTAMSTAEREEMIEAKEQEVQELEETLQEVLEDLQKQYSEASEKKDKDIEAIKESGLGLMKSVNAHIRKLGKIEL